jgi:hypothetical protein
VPHWLLPLILAPSIGDVAGVLQGRMPAGQLGVAGRSQHGGRGHKLARGERAPVAGSAALGTTCHRGKGSLALARCIDRPPGEQE